MSLKMTGVTKEELGLLAAEIQLQPAFSGQFCYIATGPGHEMLAVLKSDGRFDVQLLDRIQTARSVNKMIRSLQQFLAVRKIQTEA